MQIVIDIPEEVKHKVYAYGLSLCPSDKEQLINAIMNGTPLPKGHGRLIDAKAYEQDIRKHYFDNSTIIRCTEIALDNAPTIIEADKAESEDKERWGDKE